MRLKAEESILQRGHKEALKHIRYIYFVYYPTLCFVSPQVPLSHSAASENETWKCSFVVLAIAKQETMRASYHEVSMVLLEGALKKLGIMLPYFSAERTQPDMNGNNTYNDT